jgi:hypothetical protein
MAPPIAVPVRGRFNIVAGDIEDTGDRTTPRAFGENDNYALTLMAIDPIGRSPLLQRVRARQTVDRRGAARCLA